MSSVGPDRDATTPLTVIGGFLGAGKTTLLRRILADPRGKKIGVSVNDFGPLNIDAMLSGGQAGPIISLTNGCICCQIGDNLVAALLAMRDGPNRADAIFVEASGVADPAKIAGLGRVGRFFGLGAIVVVIDAASARAHAAAPLLSDTLLRQIRAADLLILNKVNLVKATALPALEQWLKALAPAVPMIRTVNSEVPIELFVDAKPSLEQGASNRGAGIIWTDSAEHGDRFQSWSFASTRPFSATALRAALASAAVPHHPWQGRALL